MTMAGTTMGWAPRYLRQISTQEDPGATPHTWQPMQYRQAAGALGWLCEHMDLHTVPSDVCLAMDIHGPKWRNGHPLCSMDVTLDVI